MKKKHYVLDDKHIARVKQFASDNNDEFTYNDRDSESAAMRYMIEYCFPELRDPAKNYDRLPALVTA